MMNNIIPTSNIDEYITEYLLMSKSKKPWLIVEGESDSLFFQQKMKSNVAVRIALGWEKVLNFIKEWNKISEEDRKGKKVVGIIDRDYHDILKTEIPTNIVVVDHRDLEICLFESDNTLEQILIEYGSNDKLPRINEDIDLKKVRDQVYKLAYPLTKLRFFNALNSESKITFQKPFDFSGLVDRTKFTLIEKKLVNKIAGNNKCPVTRISSILERDIPSEWNSHAKISNGHDIMVLLGVCLHSKYGSNDKGDISGEKIESIFRLTYSEAEFRESNFGKEIMRILGILTEEKIAA